MKSADLTIVIPVNEYNDVVKGYLTRAIESIENADHGHEIKAINIVGSKEVLDQIDDTLLPSKAYKKLVNNKSISFSSFLLLVFLFPLLVFYFLLLFYHFHQVLVRHLPLIQLDFCFLFHNLFL